MILERITVNGIAGCIEWIDTYNREVINFLERKEWGYRENRLRIYDFTQDVSFIERGIDSLAKPEFGIGDLVDVPHVDGNNVYYDNRYWNVLFGKTCIFNNDAKPFELFLIGGDEISYEQTELNMITKVSMKRVMDELHIPIELFTDADTYLLPSRDKFSCGFCRMVDKREVVKYRYEGGWISFYIDHDLFQEILPPSEYSRENSHDPDHGGLDGVENKYPTFDREDFITRWSNEIASMVNDPITRIVETTLGQAVITP